MSETTKKFAPEVDHLAIGLQVHLIETPAPLPEAAHSADALLLAVGSEQRAEPVPQVTYRFMMGWTPTDGINVPRWRC